MPALHYGSKRPDFLLLIIHFPTRLPVSEWASEWAQWSVWPTRAVWSKQMSERCNWISDRTSEWPSTSSVLLVVLNQSVLLILLVTNTSCYELLARANLLSLPCLISSFKMASSLHLSASLSRLVPVSHTHASGSGFQLIDLQTDVRTVEESLMLLLTSSYS